MAKTDDLALQMAYQGTIPDERTREQDLVGSPTTILRHLREIEEAGAQEVIIFLRDSAGLDSIRRIADACIRK